MVLRGQDLWRAAPIFKFGFTDVVPGFREGALLFGIFSAYEWMASKQQSSKQNHGHGNQSHGHGEVAVAAVSHGSHGSGHGVKTTEKQLH
jgi:hypothetical protein